MPQESIQGGLSRVSEIVRADFSLRMPPYQRPYAWTTEQLESLVNALIQAVTANEDAVSTLPPYHLEVFVLIPHDSEGYWLIDGKQRLLSVMLLMTLAGQILQEALPQAPKAQRETLQKTVQRCAQLSAMVTHWQLSGMEQRWWNDVLLAEPGWASKRYASLEPGQEALQQAAQNCWQQLQGWDYLHLQRLVAFVLLRCYAMLMITPNLQAALAYRHYVADLGEGRGQPLRDIDQLKITLIDGLRKQQRDYAARWEDYEVQLGENGMREVFEHIIYIHTHSAAAASLQQDLRALPLFAKPRAFLDILFWPYAEVFGQLCRADFRSKLYQEDINALLRKLLTLERRDWLAPALLFVHKYADEPPHIRDYLEHIWQQAQVDEAAPEQALRWLEAAERGSSSLLAELASDGE